jgi:hypothetical protein
LTVTARDLDDLLFMGAEQERAEDRQWLVEQRYRAVLEVLDGAPVSEVAVRYGISRQSVYAWKARHALPLIPFKHGEGDTCPGQPA